VHRVIMHLEQSDDGTVMALLVASKDVTARNRADVSDTIPTPSR